MKRITTLFVVLVTALTPGFSQKLMLTGGYAYVGQKSFTGAPALGLNTLFPVKQHLAVGVIATAARARQHHTLYIWSFGGNRTVNTLHNHLFSAHALLGYRRNLSEHLGLLAGPTVGYTAVGRREQGTSDKLGAGLWLNLTYRNVLGSHFHLEAVAHPRVLTKGPHLEDANASFSDVNLAIWDAQVGFSYGLGL